MGQWRLERGDPEEALHLFTGAMEVDPFSTAAHRGRGEALLALERKAEAKDAFETALLVPAHLDVGAGFGAPVSEEQLAERSAWLDSRRQELETLLERCGD